MRPYKFRMRLSSKRLNVTRLGTVPAAAWRAAARLSLGSASSDIVLMERLLPSQAMIFSKTGFHFALTRRRGRDHVSGGMIAPTRARCKGAVAAESAPRPVTRAPKEAEIGRHGIVSGIIIPPHFCPAPALLNWEKKTLRWPDPFGSGFLSPQPPESLGSGLFAEHGADESRSFSFWGAVD